MKIIIKFSPEIIIKSRTVRIFFIKTLVKNIKIVFTIYNKLAQIIRYWDYLEIIYSKDNDLSIYKILSSIPGIHHFLLVQDSIISSLEDIYSQIMLTNYKSRLLGKTFCVRVKRYGNHTLNSQDIERYIGQKICCNINHACVNLTEPDEIIFLEIKFNRLFIIITRFDGLGGLPIGTQQKLLSLISGGFDSAVSSYMLIKRGCIIHYCFFNLIGEVTHTYKIYEMIYYLWKKFGSSHCVKCISVDFSEIVKEIFIKIKSNYIGVVLKRFMIRAAQKIAAHYNIKALSTGEVLGQVSSQTLDNLILINSAVSSSDCLILRPLIVYDKELIIMLSRKIGTEIFSKVIPEYCGIISKSSTTKASKKKIELEERDLNFGLLDSAILRAHIINVNDIPKYIDKTYIFRIETTTELHSQDVILDIRSEWDQKNNPVPAPIQTRIKKIPFYNLIDQFPKLDQNKIYLLYCDHGIMSKLQAMHLYQQGFKNIKIYKINNIN